MRTFYLASPFCWPKNNLVSSSGSMYKVMHTLFYFDNVTVVVLCVRAILCALLLFRKMRKAGKTVWNVHVEKHVVYVGIYTMENIFRALLRSTFRKQQNDEHTDREREKKDHSDDIIIRWLENQIIYCNSNTENACSFKLHTSQK